MDQAQRNTVDSPTKPEAAPRVQSLEHVATPPAPAVADQNRVGATPTPDALNTPATPATPATGSATMNEPPAPPPPPDVKMKAPKVAPPPSKPVGKQKAIEPTQKVEQPTKAPSKKPQANQPSQSANEPSLDDLLKDSPDTKAPARPRLDKKALTTGDITAGMSAVAGKAQACFKGTNGNAVVRATVAPSGQVTKVTISGAFAGKPEGACVQAVVQSATFPPWDGGPQSFGYTYLLSE